jgi:hypothetical protein
MPLALIPVIVMGRPPTCERKPVRQQVVARFHRRRRRQP